MPKINAHLLKDGDLDKIDANLYKKNNLEVMKQRISTAVLPILPILLDTSNQQQRNDDFYRELKNDLTQIIIEIKNNKIDPPSVPIGTDLFDKDPTKIDPPSHSRGSSLFGNLED